MLASMAQEDRPVILLNFILTCKHIPFDKVCFPYMLSILTYRKNMDLRMSLKKALNLKQRQQKVIMYLSPIWTQNGFKTLASYNEIHAE